jgi:hypothetical protein
VADQIVLTSLKDAARLRGRLLCQITLPGNFVFASRGVADGKVTAQIYRNSDIHVVRLDEVRLVLNKYLLIGGDQMVHGGLTYNDYTIVDPAIDPYGFSRGPRLVRGDEFLTAEELRVPDDGNMEFSDGIWINGQTTPEPFFGHWLHENLAKIIALEDAGIHSGRLWIRKSVPSRFLDWIPLVSSGNWVTEKIDTEAAPLLKNVIIPSAVNYRSRHGGALCAWVDGLSRLRGRARAAVRDRTRNRVSGGKPIALYVARNSKWRNLINADDVRAVFDRVFELREVRFESMSPTEQVEAVTGVDVIFGPSGSSMPVVMFADPGTVVCEFFNPKNEGKWAAKVFCDLFGLPHVRIDGLPEGENLGPTPADSNYTVDIKLVEAQVAAIHRYLCDRFATRDRHDFSGVSPEIFSPITASDCSA